MTMMHEEIIKGLVELHAVSSGKEEIWVHVPMKDFNNLMRAAIDMLTPRVIPLRELADEANHCFDVVWLEGNFGGIATTAPRRVEVKGNTAHIKRFGHGGYDLAWCRDYGETWRCWNMRPTDKQREATPWRS